MMKILCFVCLLSLFSVFAEVVELNSKNFEHLTQAATGATTGDWLVDFYAPWCGHCKTLAPIYEEVSEKLDGVVNVAKIDVTANRDLGTRFDIKGFPTIKLLRQGKVYSYSGRRTVDDITEFATKGFANVEPEKVPEPVGIIGEVILVFKQAFKQARSDVKNGKYLTPDIFLIALPLIFIGLMLVIVLLPTDPAIPSPSKRTAPPAAEIVDDNKKVD